MRPGFSVMRKRPLGNNATAHGLSRFAGDGGDADVHGLVIGRVRLAGKHGMVGIQLRRSPVDRLAFDPEDLERWSVLRRVPSPCASARPALPNSSKRRGGGCSFQWLH